MNPWLKLMPPACPFCGTSWPAGSPALWTHECQPQPGLHVTVTWVATRDLSTCRDQLVYDMRFSPQQADSIISEHQPPYGERVTPEPMPDSMLVGCCQCHKLAHIPCDPRTHFYSERARAASLAGWGSTIVPSKSITYTCPECLTR